VSMYIRIAFGIPRVIPRHIILANDDGVDEDEHDNWIGLDHDEPWELVEYGYGYEGSYYSLVVRDSMRSSEIYQTSIQPEGTHTQRQKWKHILAQGCRKAGVPFVEKDCVWFASAISHQ